MITSIVNPQFIIIIFYKKNIMYIYDAIIFIL